jgi:hypothetical protein
MKKGEVHYVQWICHGAPVPDGSEYLAHGHHSALVKLPDNWQQIGDVAKRVVKKLQERK